MSNLRRASEQYRAVGDDGICEVVSPDRPAGVSALLLDRDGVIVEEVGYLHRPADVQLIPGTAELIARANAVGVPVVVVTNQAGIGRGYYGWDEFFAVNEEIERRLALSGARVDAVFACPFHVDGIAPYAVADHPDRKPLPGMFLRAEKLLGLDLSSSWLIGDTVSDVRAAVNAHLAGAAHVLTGHGDDDRTVVEGLELPEGFQLRLIDRPGDFPALSEVFDSVRPADMS